jgi:hypothetical protein
MQFLPLNVVEIDPAIAGWTQCDPEVGRLPLWLHGDPLAAESVAPRATPRLDPDPLR